MIKINHRFVVMIFFVLFVAMILFSWSCNKFLKTYFPQAFCVSENEMQTNDALYALGNYNYRIRPQNYADLVSYQPDDPTSIDLRIPEKISSYEVREIEEGCFAWCDTIKTVHIPISVEKIGHNVFYDNPSLTSIFIENENCMIEEDSFGNFNGIIYAPKDSQVFQQIKEYGYKVKKL